MIAQYFRTIPDGDGLVNLASARHLTAELGYLTSLLREGANFTNAHGIDHPSQPNYLALFSGDTQGTGSEKKRNPDGSNPIVNGRTQVGSNDLVPNTPLTTPNLGAALIAAGRSFVGYSEDLPSVGFTGASHTGPEGSGADTLVTLSRQRWSRSTR